MTREQAKARIAEIEDEISDLEAELHEFVWENCICCDQAAVLCFGLCDPCTDKTKYLLNMGFRPDQIAHGDEALLRSVESLSQLAKSPDGSPKFLKIKEAA